MNKGQMTLSAVPFAIILLVVAIVTLTTMTTVIQTIQTSQDEFATVTTINETFTGLTNISIPFNGSGLRVKDYAVVQVLNVTNGIVIPASDYTTTNNGTFLAFTLNVNGHNDTSLNITYTNSASTEPTAYNISGAGLSANKTIADFFDPIAVIIMAVVIIGLILGAFTFARRGSGSRGV